MPTNPLMPIAGRIKYTEGEPYENGSLGKKVSDLNDQLANMGTSGGDADWDAAKGQPGYIANKPFYTNGCVSIPEDAQDGTKTYWEGITGNEVLGVDKFKVTEDTHGGELPEGQGDPVYIYKVSDKYISPENARKITKDDMLINYFGQMISVTELEEQLNQELPISIIDEIPGACFIVVEEELIMLVSFENDTDLSTLGAHGEGIAPAGTYLLTHEIDENEFLYIKNLSFEDLKTIDPKFIPKVASFDEEKIAQIVETYVDENILGGWW